MMLKKTMKTMVMRYRHNGGDVEDDEDDGGDDDADGYCC